MLNLTTKAYIAVTETLRNFKKDERGVTAIEYGLIALAMAAFVVFVFSNEEGFVQSLRNQFSTLSETVEGFELTSSSGGN